MEIDNMRFNKGRKTERFETNTVTKFAWFPVWARVKSNGTYEVRWLETVTVEKMYRPQNGGFFRWCNVGFVD